MIMFILSYVKIWVQGSPTSTNDYPSIEVSKDFQAPTIPASSKYDMEIHPLP